MDNKYYENYRRFTTSWEYSDQEEYSELEVALEELEAKEVVSVEEYNAEVSRLEATNDYENLENYRHNYVSEVDYHFTKEELEEKMRKLQEYYRVTNEQLAEDKRIRAMYSRDRLRLIKRSYESRGYSNILRDLDVDSLTDDRAIELYREIRHNISAEQDREIGNRAIWDRVGKKENKKTEIEKEIEKFQNDCDKIKTQLEEIKRTLVLDDELDLDVTEAIRGLDTELRELGDTADSLIADMDEFKASVGEESFSMTPVQIKDAVKEFRRRLKDIKQHQIDKYNARVDATNKIIEELKGLEGLDEETALLVEELSVLERCDVSPAWNSTRYLDSIDYHALIDVNNRIAVIEARRNGMIAPTPGPDTDVDLESDMLWIENEISRINSVIESDIAEEEINQEMQNILSVADRINSFRVKLENNKELMTVDYDGYLERLNDAEADLAELNTKLNGRGRGTDDHKNVYKDLMERLNTLDLEVVNLTNLIESLHGHVVETAVSVFEAQLATLDGRLEEIKNDIEKNKTEGKLDENQYNQLMKKVSELEAKLKIAREKALDPGVVKEADIFALLNGQIDGLEKALDALEQKIDSLEKPIKDKTVRKEIDTTIKRLEEEIKLIEKHLEMYKDKDPEKYEATKERLNNVKDRLDKISKNYRKKCPLLVRAVKSAKDFYKKHKKICLIAAGLAAIALIHATVGPVLIPAIMHGNIMLQHTVPALSEFMKFSNNILGSLINARCTTNGVWYLANGVGITPGYGCSSLLKGLAISGIGNALLVTPIVIAIKQLTEKMRKAKLKDKMGELIKEKPKAKEKEKKPSIKKADKNTIEDLARLFKEYRKSGMSLEQFAEENQLTEEDLTVLRYLESNSREYVNEESRKGRR